jgi:hypothetical protein
MDLTGQFEALRAIATSLTRKEEVPAELWAQANMPAGTPLKKVNAEITKLKKVVSSTTKAVQSDDEDEEDGPAGKKGGRQDTRAKKDVRRIGADTKARGQAMDRGEGGLTSQRVGDDGAVYGDE